jgi:putative transposase
MIEKRNEKISVEAMCDVLDVSPSGYYASRHRNISAHEESDMKLGQEVERVFLDSRRTYGSDRVEKQLRDDGICTSRKRVARLMQERGLRSVRARKRRHSLTRKGNHSYIVPNLLQQDFTAHACNEKWVADTTYVPTHEGWLYLVCVMDLYSRQIVGWAMGDHHDAQLATDALDMAIQRHHPAPGLIVHSDRGSEFANAKFHNCVQQARIQLSMSSTGNCYDNAPAESVFATIKLEAVQNQVFDSKQQARYVLFEYIEVFYNRQRLHSGIDYNCPVNLAA